MATHRFGYPVADWDATKEMARRILRARAVLPNPTITYSGLANLLKPIHFEPDSPAFHEMLGEVSTEEDADGHGMLSVLVVHKDGDQMPGAGFFTLAGDLGRELGDPTGLWIDELNRVVDCWTSRRA
jgi:hypothetical protein